jgi:hypothetical protein
VICVDELGPLLPRSYPLAPGWSANGHRLKEPLEYSRGPEKVWVYGALRPHDGHALTCPSRARNTAGYRTLLDAVVADNPTGALYVITDNLSSHKSPPIVAWLAEHPQVQQAFLPVGACWLNLQEGWWRLFRREALAGQSFANGEEIEQITALATTKLNARAHPWVWNRPPQPRRHRRRRFVYLL